jgi:hypothetical protein
MHMSEVFLIQLTLDLFSSFFGNVEIYFRCHYRIMTRHFLVVKDICSFFQVLFGERMPLRMYSGKWIHSRLFHCPAQVDLDGMHRMLFPGLALIEPVPRPADGLISPDLLLHFSDRVE